MNMSNRDGTGPEGKGAKTGRGQGNCNPQESTNEEIPQGRGFGNRRLLGKGNRRRQNRD